MRGAWCVVVGLLLVGVHGLHWDLEEATDHLYYAYTAFCPDADIKAWNCQWCTRDHVKVTGVVESKIMGTKGYVGADVQSKRMVVMFRGSSNVQNDIEDINFFKTPVPYPGATQGAEVHEGFLSAYNSVREEVRTAFKEAQVLCPGCAAHIGGHSLGASMSVLAAADIATHFKGVRPRIYNFGCPRTGNLIFEQWLSNVTQPDNTRVTRQLDPVPHLPLEIMGFHHWATEVWERWMDHNHTFTVCDGSGEDQKCSNSEINLDPAEHTKYLNINGGGCSK